MSKVEIRYYEAKQGEPRIPNTLTIDGKRIDFTSLDIDTGAFMEGYPAGVDLRGYKREDHRIQHVWYRLLLDGAAVMETLEKPTRTEQHDGSVIFTWNGVKVSIPKGLAMNDELDARIMRDAIVSTQDNIRADLSRLADTLGLYGFLVNDCDVDITLDRAFGGDIHYRFGVRIGVEVKR